MQGTFDITESRQQLSAHEFKEMLKLRMMIQTIISSGQSIIISIYMAVSPGGLYRLLLPASTGLPVYYIQSPAADQ